MPCPKHRDKNIEFVCKLDGRLLCSKCILEIQNKDVYPSLIAFKPYKGRELADKLLKKYEIKANEKLKAIQDKRDKFLQKWEVDSAI